MSEGVELPEMDVNLADLETARTQDAMRKHICRDGLLLSIYCRERQLREAIAQVEDLNNSNAGIDLCYRVERDRAEKAEGEIATSKADFQRIVLECERQRAEIAALREGATVRYEVRLNNPNWSSGLLADVGTVEKAKAIRKECLDRGADGVDVVEIITRERILDAELCKHCGPDCIPGAAHNARSEDGVIWGKGDDE